MARPKGKGAPRRREGYLPKSPAICIVVHDPSGKPMPDSLAAEFTNIATDFALKNGYLVNFTRT